MPIFVGNNQPEDTKLQGYGKGVSIGSTDTVGRNAGIGTVTGTLIYNSTDGAVQVYNGPSGWQIVGEQASVSGILGASGGTLVSPNPGGYEIRHFPSGPQTFSYISAGDDEKIHVLVVGGGGGGGFGGGGGGGVAYAYNLPVPSSSTTYTIQIGAGGASRANGGNSTFAGHPVGTITAAGGGGNIPPQGGNTNQRYGGPGGSGGGGGHSPDFLCPGGTETQTSQNPGYSWAGGALYQYGQPGGRGNTTSPNCCEGGGGGGATGPSPLTAPLPATFRETGTYNGPQNSGDIAGDGNGGGNGGNGITFGWVPTGLGDNGYFAGGGPGSYCAPNSGGADGGAGTGQCDPVPRSSSDGQPNTGGGGGGGNATARTGGTGIVLVYYLAQ